MAAEQKAFGVYVHWPFCLSKCPYCDFNSHVRHAPVDEERFVKAFAREIETTAQRAGERTVSSIFLGGGTPSLMTSRSRWKPIRPASRPRDSAAIARRASTACRSACRRWTMSR